jgi:hypothetical protein
MMWSELALALLQISAAGTAEHLDPFEYDFERHTHRGLPDVVAVYPGPEMIENFNVSELWLTYLSWMRGEIDGARHRALSSFDDWANEPIGDFTRSLPGISIDVRSEDPEWEWSARLDRVCRDVGFHNQFSTPDSAQPYCLWRLRTARLKDRDSWTQAFAIPAFDAQAAVQTLIARGVEAHSYTWESGDSFGQEYEGLTELQTAFDVLAFDELQCPAIRQFVERIEDATREPVQLTGHPWGSPPPLHATLHTLHIERTRIGEGRGALTLQGFRPNSAALQLATDLSDVIEICHSDTPTALLPEKI